MESSLPLSMRYAVTGADGIPSRTRLSRFDATSSEYSANSNNQILIPCSADGFISSAESYLFMRVESEHDTAGVAHLEGDLSCLIDKIEIQVQGSSGKVETIDNYNTYSLLDSRYNSDLSDATYNQIVSGAHAPNLVYNPRGARMERAGGNGGVPDHTIVAVKLKAGFLNSYYDKALPMGLPQFTIMLTLASATDALIFTDAGATNVNYKVSQVRWYAPVFQILDENVMGAYTRQIQSSPTMWIGQSVSTVVNTTAAGAARRTYQLNASYKSLNGMVSVIRNNTNLNNIEKASIANSTIVGCLEFLYRIGSSQFPSDSIEIGSVEATATGFNLSRAYIEAVKTFAKHGKMSAKNTQVNRDAFIANETGNAPTSCGAGVLAINLKRYTDDRLVNVGLNTAGSGAPSTLEVNFDGTAVAGQVNTFCLYDCVWIMNPNGLVERSF